MTIRAHSAQVRFQEAYQIDLSGLIESLVPFGTWNEERIAAEMPVEVFYSDRVTDCLDYLSRRVYRDPWPADLRVSLKEGARALVERQIHELTIEIIRAVRLITAATVRDDGSRATDVRARIAKMFLEAKMLSMSRVIKSHALQIGSDLHIDGENDKLPSIWTPRIIFGLAYLARHLGTWAGWTDANLYCDGYFKPFVPICCAPLNNEPDVERLCKEEFDLFVVPQLFVAHRYAAPSHKALREVVLGETLDLDREVLLRYENFIDTNTCTDGHEARENISKIVAARIISILGKIPKSERLYVLQDLTLGRRMDCLDVRARVRKALEID